MHLNKEKLILALDVDSIEKAKELVDELYDYIGVFKVGKELFTRVGFDIVHYIQEKGGKVFLDLKYHDIPTTVKRASRAASELGVFMFNVHASGGEEMMHAAVDGVALSGRDDVITLAVTVLTSIDQNILTDEVGVDKELEEHVIHLATLAKHSGIKGVVASPKEIKLIRETCGLDFLIVTPGVRPTWASKGDQKRVMTPKEAIAAGANYIVVGRPITQAEHRVAAAKKIIQEIQ